MSTVYTMTRTPDLLPGTLDLLILGTLQKGALHGWATSEHSADSRDVVERMANAIGRVMKSA